MKKQITLKDIAAKLGVSISTASKALRNSEEISSETKERIQAYAKLHHYRPNNIAVSLKSRRTMNIGVIIPDIVHHFFSTVILGIEKQASEQGYNVIVCVSNESFDKEVINMEMLANGSIDGFIVSLSSGTQLKKDYNHLKEVTDQGLPLVLFDRITNEIDCDKVVIDDKLGAYIATNKLIKEGRKKIGLITTEDYISVGKVRTEGYRQALVDNNIEIDESLILKLSSLEIDREPINDFFETIKMDAVICVTEMLAAYSMTVAMEKGFKIPKEISFIGFTNGPLSQYANPTLTCIDQHGETMGMIAAKRLIEKIEKGDNKEIFKTEIIKPTLIERNSTIN